MVAPINVLDWMEKTGARDNLVELSITFVYDCEMLEDVEDALDDMEAKTEMPSEVLEFYSLGTPAATTPSFDLSAIFSKEHLPKFERGKIILKFCVYEEPQYSDVELASARARTQALAQQIFTPPKDVTVEGLIENGEDIIMALVDSEFDTDEDDH